MNKRIKNIYIDTELALPMYNVHPFFSLKNLGKKVHIINGKIWYLLQYGHETLASLRNCQVNPPKTVQYSHLHRIRQAPEVVCPPDNAQPERTLNNLVIAH